MSRARWIAAALLLSFTTFSLDAEAQSTTARQPAVAKPASFPWEGEVTGTNVRVRSGAGTSWYATTKLNTSDRVLVVGERHGWYEIAPLASSFSYVDAADVTRDEQAQTAIVKRDGVSARAGSELASSKSTPQAILKKGDSVTILGEVDGFYKIVPPPGAVLYISKDYVRPIASNLRTGMAERYAAIQPPQPKPTAPASANGTPAALESKPNAAEPVNSNIATTGNEPATPGNTAAQPGIGTGAVPPDSDVTASETDITDPEDGQPIEADPTIQALKNPVQSETQKSAPAGGAMNKASGRYQALYTAAESDLQATMQLPSADRDLDTLIRRYQEIANQNEERVPSECAKIRVGQLQKLADLRKTRADVIAKTSELDSFRARMTTERMKIMRARAEKVTEKFDFVGELRKSYAFAPEKRRYRLVDPKRQTTIAYIDIPRDITENAEFMVGRTVGVRSSGQRYSMAARIPIAVAASITDLTPSVNEMADEAQNGGDVQPPTEIMPPPLNDEPTDTQAPAGETNGPKGEESTGADDGTELAETPIGKPAA